MRARWFFLVPLLLALPFSLFAQQWYSVQTDHLISYSSGNDHGARDAAMRGEQLIAVYGQIFHRKGKEITFATPLRVRAIHTAEPSSQTTYPVLVRTPAADFVSGDPGQPDSWIHAAQTIAMLTLEDNYPRAQPWFDSGIASYLAGVRFSGDQMELGIPPPGMVLPTPGEWIPVAKLFEIEPSKLTAAQHKVFEAESWAVVRWLIDNSRLGQAGAYLNAVQAHGATTERALAEAFAMSSADLDREVRESMKMLSGKKMPAPHVESTLITSQKLAPADVHVLEVSLSLFGPDAERTLQDLVAFMRQNQDNVAVHRALAWAFLLRNDLDGAVEHIRRALALDDSDPAMHYLYARWVNQGEGDRIIVASAKTRMGTELKAALQRDPNYSAALELLGLAELSDDAVKPALANLQRASALRPRSSRYYLNLARAYEAAGNLDSARNLIIYARGGDDVAVSAEAGKLLTELGKQKKRQQQWAALAPHPDPTVKHSKYDNLQEAIAEDEKAEAKSQSVNAGSQKDARKVEFLKGRIVGVECASSTGATLTVNSAGSTWQMQVADRNTIVLIGVNHFNCGWHDVAASINYKKRGKLMGDLISLEID